MSCIGERLSTTKLVRKITIFAETLCGKRFYAYQVEFAQRIFRAILENDQDTITGLMARQCGKSYTVSLTTAAVMIILPILANMPMFLDDPRLRLFRDGMKVGIFAPCKHRGERWGVIVHCIADASRLTEIQREHIPKRCAHNDCRQQKRHIRGREHEQMPPFYLFGKKQNEKHGDDKHSLQFKCQTRRERHHRPNAFSAQTEVESIDAEEGVYAVALSPVRAV